MIINGEKIAAQINLETKKELLKIFQKKKKKFLLGVVLVGNNQASENFIKRKEEAAKFVGLDFKLFKYPASIPEEELLRNLVQIQNLPSLVGLVIQLPLPKNIKSRPILEQINSNFDVDCLTSYHLGQIAAGLNEITPPTAGAIYEIIRRLKLDLKGKKIVIVGKGELVGKPLNLLLQRSPGTIIICDKYTQDLEQIAKEGDILVSGTGVPGLIREEMVKKGAVVIDAGVSFKNGIIRGDVNFKEVSKIASNVTPTPGGVGPVTVAYLLRNCLILAKKIK